jgi:hypothetical protein
MTDNIYAETNDDLDPADESVSGEGQLAAEAFEALEDTNTVEEVMVLDELDDPELVLPVWEPTGEPRVDAALDSLSLLDGAEVSDHASVFTEVHIGLRQVLADLDADRL